MDKNKIDQIARRKFEEAMRSSSDKKKQADFIVRTSVLINMGLGAVPLGINVWTFMGVNALMIVFLGKTYSYEITKEQAGKIIKQIFGALSFTFLAASVGLKFFAEVLKGTGIITMGGTTVAGMALDAALCGAISYALGETAKEYFKNNCKLSDEQAARMFKQKYEEGKKVAKDLKKENNNEDEDDY